METVDLTDGGLLFYDEAFLPAELADRYFIDLRDHCAGNRSPRFSATCSPALRPRTAIQA